MKSYSPLSPPFLPIPNSNPSPSPTLKLRTKMCDEINSCLECLNTLNCTFVEKYNTNYYCIGSEDDDDNIVNIITNSTNCPSTPSSVTRK